MRSCLHSLALCLLALFGLPASADDKADRQRRVKVALALSAETEPVVTVAPAPRTSGYPEAWKKSKDDLVPIVVYIGYRGPSIPGAACVRDDDYSAGGTAPEKPSVVIGYPVGDRLVESARIKGDKGLYVPVSLEAIKSAVAEARGKIGKEMPAKASMPKPFADYQIKGDCPCGGACRCLPGQCPSCPVGHGVIVGPVTDRSPAPAISIPACIGPT